ncbi:hypothetical protein N9D57_00740 [bacterium]|nr:hypothetical protein [bacterium]
MKFPLRKDINPANKTAAVDAAPTRTSGDRLPSNERVGRMSSGWSTAMRKSSS